MAKLFCFVFLAMLVSPAVVYGSSLQGSAVVGDAPVFFRNLTLRKLGSFPTSTKCSNAVLYMSNERFVHVGDVRALVIHFPEHESATLTFWRVNVNEQWFVPFSCDAKYQYAAWFVLRNPYEAIMIGDEYNTSLCDVEKIGVVEMKCKSQTYTTVYKRYEGVTAANMHFPYADVNQLMHEMWTNELVFGATENVQCHFSNVRCDVK